MSDDVQEVYAIADARVDRRSPNNFLGGDPHDVPMPLAYYVWLIVSASGRTVVVDTGFDQRGADLRKREITLPVGQGLRDFGVDGAAVEMSSSPICATTTAHLQAVRVRTRRGFVVLASDVAHFYAHLDQRRPYPVIDSVPAMLEGFATVERLASSRDHVIPGHDPIVKAIYPAARPGSGDWAVRLDAEPKPR